MADPTVQSLILDLLEWLAVADRTSPTGGQHAILSPACRGFFSERQNCVLLDCRSSGVPLHPLSMSSEGVPQNAVRFEPVCANTVFFATSTKCFRAG